MAQSAEDLLVRIDATTESLRRELRRADDNVQKFDRSVGKRLQKIDQRFQRLGRGIQGVSAALGGLAAAAGARELGRLGTQALNSAEQVQRMADSLGVGVETVQELQFTFSRFGLQQKDVNDALATLADRAQDAIDGTKSIQEDFQSIGISVDQLRGKNPAELMRLVADAIADTQGSSRRAAAAVRILEDEMGQRLLPLLTEGSQGFDRFAQKANEFGLVLDEALIRKGAEAAGELDTLRLAARSAFDTGVIEGFTSEFDGVEEALKSVTDISRDFGEALGSALATVTQDADELLQRMENISRLVLGVVGAFKGSRFGVPGAIIGGTAGALSPDIASLLFQGLGDEGGAIEAQTEKLNELLADRERILEKIEQSGQPVSDFPLQQQRLEQLNQQIEAERSRIREASNVNENALDPLGRLNTPGELGGGGLPPPDPGGGGGDKSAPIDVPTPPQRPDDLQPPSFDAMQRSSQIIAEQNQRLDDLGNQLRNDLNPAWARYQERMQNLRTALDANRISQREFNELAQQAGQTLNEQADQGTEGLRRMQQAADQLGFTFSSAFEDAIVQGENLSSVLQGLLQDIQRIIIRQAVTKPLGNAFSGAISDGLGSVFSGFFGGGGSTGGAAVPTSQGGLGQPLPTFAEGGITRGPSLAGERGPEAVVPLPGNRRIPVEMRGGGDVNVQIINQGQPAEVERTERRVQPDGKTQLKVFLRSEMKNAVNDGSLDKPLETNFGLSRQGKR